MVKANEISAIVSEKEGKFELRCGYCGKKLLEFEKNIPKNSKKVLTNSKKYDIILTVRCTRCVHTNSFHI